MSKSCLLGVAVLTLGRVAPEALADASYKDYILARGARYYWNWDDGSFGGSPMISSNLGAGTGGQLYTPVPTSPVPGTSNARGLSLGNAALFVTTTHENWYTASPGTPMDDGIYTKWAIEFWTYIDPTIDNQYSIIGMDGTPSFYFGYNAPSGTLRLLNTDMQAISTGVWHHVVIADDGSTAAAIIDGNVAGKTTASLGLAFDASNANYLRIGSWFGTANKFKGQIDEFAIYNLTGLSTAQYDLKLEQIASDWNIPEPSVALLLLSGGLVLWRGRGRK